MAGSKWRVGGWWGNKLVGMHANRSGPTQPWVGRTNQRRFRRAMFLPTAVRLVVKRGNGRVKCKPMVGSGKRQEQPGNQPLPCRRNLGVGGYAQRVRVREGVQHRGRTVGGGSMCHGKPVPGPNRCPQHERENRASARQTVCRMGATTKLVKTSNRWQRSKPTIKRGMLTVCNVR